VQEGIVKWFSEKKGYGFITSEQGDDLFVHVSGINPSGAKPLGKGVRVAFEVEQTQKGPQAKNVKAL